MLTLYDAARCPYCARVRIVLAEKDVEYEPIEIDLTDRPAWIYEKNSTGRVPVIEEDGWLLPESAVIMEFLEERYPEPPLLAADPADRALARLWIFRHDDFTKPYYALRRGEDGAAARFEAELGKLDAALEQRAWLGGSAYGLADIAYVPWVLRARDMLGVSLEAFPAVSAVARAACRATFDRHGGRRRCSTLSSHASSTQTGSRVSSAPTTSSSATSVGRTRTCVATSRVRVRSSSARRRPRPMLLRSRSSRRRSRCACAGTASPARNVSCSSTAATASVRCPPRRWRSSRGIRASRSCSEAWRRGPASSSKGLSSSSPCGKRCSSRIRARCRPGRRSSRGSAIPTLTLLDVRRDEEYTGKRGNQCDPRQGHIPGAKRVEVGELFAAPGQPLAPEMIRELVGAPEGAEVVAYCHSGSRSALATLALAERRLRRPELRRLLARVEPVPRATARALRAARRRRALAVSETPRRATARARSSARCFRASPCAAARGPAAGHLRPPPSPRPALR